MKCINNFFCSKNIKRSNSLRRGLIAGLCVLSCIALSGCARDMDFPYETMENISSYNPVQVSSLQSQKLSGFASDLCLPQVDTEESVSLNIDNIKVAGLFDVDHVQTLYAQGVTDRLYPASTTKIMTALVALKYGDLSQTITFSDNALNLAADAQRLGLTAGDSMSLEQALNYLLIFSANDVANAIAENIGGSIEHFVEMMNEEAAAIGALHTNFTNPHGLHDDAHYTTAYDLYLIFNEAMQYDTFTEIIPKDYYTTMFTASDGSPKSIEVYATDSYLVGSVEAPEGITVMGGKTGTTDLAGHCLIIMSQNETGNRFISVVMGAEESESLYAAMNSLLAQIPN